jgi:acetolactate synthase-1/2/3 large subunit
MAQPARHVKAVTAASKPESGEKISGGHLVAKALRAEGIDVIFTLCGGHIIDIYDGCLDEGIKSSMSGTNKCRPCRRWLCARDR